MMQTYRCCIQTTSNQTIIIIKKVYLNYSHLKRNKGCDNRQSDVNKSAHKLTTRFFDHLLRVPGSTEDNTFLSFFYRTSSTDKDLDTRYKTWPSLSLCMYPFTPNREEEDRLFFFVSFRFHSTWFGLISWILLCLVFFSFSTRKKKVKGQINCKEEDACMVYGRYKRKKKWPVVYEYDRTDTYWTCCCYGVWLVAQQ